MPDQEGDLTPLSPYGWAHIRRSYDGGRTWTVDRIEPIFATVPIESPVKWPPCPCGEINH